MCTHGDDYLTPQAHEADQHKKYLQKEQEFRVEYSNLRDEVEKAIENPQVGSELIWLTTRLCCTYADGGLSFLGYF